MIGEVKKTCFRSRKGIAYEIDENYVENVIF